MNSYYKEYKKLFKKNECSFYLHKNGKIKFYRTINNRYLKLLLCVLNNKYNYQALSFPQFTATDDENLLKQLIFFKYLTKTNLKYIIRKNTVIKKKNQPLNTYYFFKEENKNNILTLLIFIDIVKYDLKFIDKFIDYIFFIRKLYFINEKDIFISIFYEIYIKDIEKEIFKKYSKKISDFKNYHELYLFLKKKGYVKKYYNKICPKLKNEYPIILDKVINHPLYEKLKKKYISKIKNLKDINIINTFNKGIFQKFDKKNIINKYIQIIKKYNII